MFRTNKAFSLAAAALRGEQNVLWRQRGTAGAKPWSALVDALALEQGGLTRGYPQNWSWGIPKMGSATCASWKGMGDLEKL